MRLATSRACWELWQRMEDPHGQTDNLSVGGGLTTLLSPAAGPEFILERLARARQAPNFGGTGFSAASTMGPRNSIKWLALFLLEPGLRVCKTAGSLT